MQRTSLFSAFRVLGAVALSIGLTTSAPVHAQEAHEAYEDEPHSTVVGRVLDLESSGAVTDAVVHLEGHGLRAISDTEGLFRFPEVPAGSHTLVIRHVAYGEQRDTIEVVGDETVAIRVTLSRRAIELDPVVVSVLSTDEIERRARGTRRNEITRPDIRRAAGGSVSLGALIGDQIPGAWVRDRPARPGQDICVEFRRPSSVEHALTCKYPMVVLDGVRVRDAGFILTAMNLRDVERIEVLSPAEAGLLYGTGSGWGVVVIETQPGGLDGEDAAEEDRLPYALGESAVYPWELEQESHPWGKAFAGAVLGNAVGLTAGILLARQCLEVTDSGGEALRIRCGTWATVGSQLAVAGLPLGGTALGARLGGETRASRGQLLPAAIASAVALIPGYVIATSGTGTSSALQWVGAGIISLGVPAAATLADRFFRTFDPDD